MTGRQRLKRFLQEQIEVLEAAEPTDEMIGVLYETVDGLDNLDFGQSRRNFCGFEVEVMGRRPALSKRL